MIREALNQRPQLGVGFKEQNLNLTTMSIDIKKAVSNKLVLTRLPQIIFSTGNKITPLVFNLLVVLSFCKIALAGGASLGSFGFHIFSVQSSAKDDSATALPSALLCWFFTRL